MDNVLFIIGDDFMAPGYPGKWEYVSIGLHYKTKQGQMKFTDGKKVTSVDLVSWPHQLVNWVPAAQPPL